MSFLKFLFGKNANDNNDGERLLGEDDYKGYIISAYEKKSGAEFQIFGTIEKEIGGEKKCRQFIRADRLSSIEEVREFTLKKGRQIIDEQGDDLFDNEYC